jgi:hypothetical protein
MAATMGEDGEAQSAEECNAVTTPIRLREMQDGLQGANRATLLFEDMCSQAHVGNGTSEQDAASGDGAIQGGQEPNRIMPGASEGDGGTPGQETSEHGACPPSERRPIGQSTGEPGRDPDRRPCEVTYEPIPHVLSPYDPQPCTVLDPFGGAGTTALVALRYGRRAILCELNPDYIDMARRRCAGALAQGTLAL